MYHPVNELLDGPVPVTLLVLLAGDAVVHDVPLGGEAKVAAELGNLKKKKKKKIKTESSIKSFYLYE